MGGIIMIEIINLTGIDKYAKEHIVEKDYVECENTSDEVGLKREYFEKGASWMLQKAIEWLGRNVENFANALITELKK